MKTPKEKKHYNLCNLEEIEDKAYFLLRCPLHNNIRTNSMVHMKITDERFKKNGKKNILCNLE
jgi:hypothetical protein